MRKVKVRYGTTIKERFVPFKERRRNQEGRGINKSMLSLNSIIDTFHAMSFSFSGFVINANRAVSPSCAELRSVWRIVHSIYLISRVFIRV